MRRAGVLLALFLASCMGTISPPPVPNPNPPPAGQATCATACDNARRLHCTFANPTPNGGTCEQVCQNNQDVGIAAFDLDCRSTVGSCPAIDACR